MGHKDVHVEKVKSDPSAEFQIDQDILRIQVKINKSKSIGNTGIKR